MSVQKQSFFKDHADAIAIIASNVGLILAVVVIMITLWLSNSSRVDSAHNRIDAVHVRIDTIKQGE